MFKNNLMRTFEKLSNSTVSSASKRLQLERVYDAVAQEISEGVRKEGLWVKSQIECGGDEKKTAAIYFELRVQSLLDELQVQNAERETAFRAQKLRVRKENEDQLRRVEQQEENRKKMEAKQRETSFSKYWGYVLPLAFIALMFIGLSLFG